MKAMEIFATAEHTEQTQGKDNSKMKYTYDENGVRTDAPDWFKRLHAEHKELQERCVKLSAFLGNEEAIGKVSYEQQILLDKQFAAMVEYKKILHLRLTLAANELSAVKDPAPMLGVANAEIEVQEGDAK